MIVGERDVPDLQAIVKLLASYVPGAVTASVLVIPFTRWLACRAVVDAYVSGRGLIVAVVVGVVFYSAAIGPLLGLD